MIAWLPVVVGFPLAIGLMVDNWTAGLLAGLRSATIGGVLAVGVWWLTGRIPWPKGRSVRFYLLHFAAAILYAKIWLTAAAILAALEEGISLSLYFAEVRENRFVAWNLLLRVTAYGLVAGVSYATRIREDARTQELRAAELDALATRAQLTALRSQLNPHFLFNTLHSLSALVRRDPDRAEEAVEILGDLLRYALDRGGGERVLLREEWSFVQSYVWLEQLRLQERLRFEARVDEDLLDRWVPPFCLQPLVENAIRHGIDPSPTGGTVRLTIAEVCGRLELRIEDDGPGLRAPSPVGTERRIRRGLKNLRGLLAMWSGGPGRLELGSGAERGVVARVTLPLRSPAVHEFEVMRA